MNKKITTILFLIITFVVIILAFLQVRPIIKKTPPKDFKAITISEANKVKQDNSMALSFLYNITREKHPIGSEENYHVRDYIIGCLEECNVEFEKISVPLDEKFFTEIKETKKKEYERIKNETYEDFKKNAPNGDVDAFIKNELNYNSFDEYYDKEIGGSIDFDKALDDSYNYNVSKYKDRLLTNILVSLSKNNKIDGQNILLVAHYDSAEKSYGASDDGMAVAGLLETIRLYNNQNFKNNIYILFTDGEEAGLWGANEFAKSNSQKFDLIINFDNCGSSGNPILYHYTNGNIAKQCFKIIKKEASYSITNDILHNPDSKFFQGETSDAFLFAKNGYTILDFALTADAFNYHSEYDSFDNVNTDSLKKITSTMIQIVSYYGNNDVLRPSNEKFIFFKIMPGIELALHQSIYITIVIVCLIISFGYIIWLFKKKDKIIKRIINIVLTVASLVVLILFRSPSLLIILPVILFLISDLIKNKKIKLIFMLVSFELYLFILIQFIVPFIEYIYWILAFWKNK